MRIIWFPIFFYVVVLLLNLLMSTLLFHFSPLLFDLFFFFFYSIDLINLNIFLTYRNTFIFFSSFSQSYISRATTCFQLINNKCSLSFIWILLFFPFFPFFPVTKRENIVRRVLKSVSDSRQWWQGVPNGNRRSMQIYEIFGWRFLIFFLWEHWLYRLFIWYLPRSYAIFNFWCIR